MAFYTFLKCIPGLVPFHPASGSFKSNYNSVFIFILIVIKHPILGTWLNILYERLKEALKNQHLN